MDNQQVVFLKYLGLKFGIYANGEIYNFNKINSDPVKIKFYLRNDGYSHYRYNGKLYYLHRLIALAYIPNPHNYHVVNHIDGNKSNNCAENLEWCSVSHNAKDAEKRGKVYSLEKPRGKTFSKDDRERIFNYIFNNFSENNTQLALKLNTSRTTIRYYKKKILNDYPEREYNTSVLETVSP